jgi:hypothetical protein
MKAYPYGSVEEFTKIIEDLFYSNPDENYHMIFNRLINDEYASDPEMEALMFGDDVAQEVVDTLIPLRNYFWDFNYTKDI